MSTATVELDPVERDEEIAHYRALHTGALIGLLLGVLSVTVVIIAKNSFGGCLFAAVIPLVGGVISIMSLIKIRRRSDEYTGETLAKLGLVLSLLFLVTGVAYGGYTYATEVPDGYSRISFGTMKPDEMQERNGQIVPPEIAALEGKKVFIKGYIRQDSIKASQGIDQFLLVRDNQQCCFGDLSTVKYYDRILVNMVGTKRMNNSVQVVKIGGTLHMEPDNAFPRPGQIFRPPVFSLQADYTN